MILINKDDCDFCGTCVAICPEDCIEVFVDNIEIDYTKCTECMLCIHICPIDVISQDEEQSI